MNRQLSHKLLLLFAVGLTLAFNSHSQHWTPLDKPTTLQKTSTGEAHFKLAEIYLRKGDLDQALVYLDSAQESIANTENPIIVDIYDLYNYIFARKGDYEKAYHFHRMYTHSKDSLNNTIQLERFNALENKYNIQEKETEITVLSAQKKVKHAQFIMLVGLSLLVITLIFLTINRNRLLSRSEAQLLELDEKKSRFFANLSHEFRTPLSLIIAPLQRLINNLPNTNQHASLVNAYTNAQSLHELVNQLLELSQIDSGHMKLHVAEGNIATFVRGIYSRFENLALSKKISFQLISTDPSLMGFLDNDKLDTILTNLLNNAFKFTPIRGEIFLEIQTVGKLLYISIRNTDKGIPLHKIGKTFNRFASKEEKGIRSEMEFGIGLSLAKELTILHKGFLTVKSDKTMGCEFILSMPISKSAYHAKEMMTHPISRSRIQKKVFPEVKEKEVKDQSEINGTIPTLLIVDENVDIQSTLINQFNHQYKIIIANNTKQAWRAILEKVPDMVITDYVLPHLNGIALCEHIKNHRATSHIPVILLTAKSDHKTKLKGLECAADAFIKKPFDYRELDLTITNLIEGREKLKFSLDLNKGKTPYPKEAPNLEEKFISYLINSIEKNYFRTDFRIDMLASEVGMSRMQLHRKTKVLTNQTPGDILREFRLKKAKELLTTTECSVGEVAFLVGFNNHSSFTKSFKEYTGSSPSAFQNRFSRAPFQYKSREAS